MMISIVPSVLVMSLTVEEPKNECLCLSYGKSDANGDQGLQVMPAQDILPLVVHQQSEMDPQTEIHGTNSIRWSYVDDCPVKFPLL